MTQPEESMENTTTASLVSGIGPGYFWQIPQLEGELRTSTGSS